MPIDRTKEMVSVSEASRHLAGLLAKLRARVSSKFFLTKNKIFKQSSLTMSLFPRQGRPQFPP